MPKEHNSGKRCLRSFLRNVSLGRIESGLFLNRKYVYTT